MGTRVEMMKRFCFLKEIKIIKKKQSGCAWRGGEFTKYGIIWIMIWNKDLRCSFGIWTKTVEIKKERNVYSLWKDSAHLKEENKKFFSKIAACRPASSCPATNPFKVRRKRKVVFNSLDRRRRPKKFHDFLVLVNFHGRYITGGRGPAALWKKF